LKPPRPLAFSRSGGLWAALAGLALAGTVQGAPPAPALYAGDGGWGVVAGMAESVAPPADGWVREGDQWVGRIPAGRDEFSWGGTTWAVADALPLPLAPAVLPPVRNAFGPCVVRSLSVRFDSQIRAHRWSLVFAKEGALPGFVPLALNHGEPVALWMSLEDVESGGRWELTPERMGREGGMFEREKGESRLYAGMVDGGRIEWHAVVARAPGGRRIVQVRLRNFEGPPRRLRLRVELAADEPGKAVLQDELPPAVVAGRGDGALAMFVDLAEPRRFRAVLGDPGRLGMEFDLAVTRATGNFPRSATVSVEVDAWASAGAESMEDEAIGQLTHLGGVKPMPESVWRDGWGEIPVYEPGRLVLTHPGGFRDVEDALHHLMLRMSGLFAGYDWSASAFLCLAQDGEGEPRVELDGETAVVAVNADPDLETVLELGQNRGLTLLARILGHGAPAVWIRASGDSPGLDYQARALHLCDYPALWEEGSDRIGVELRHAEAELMASLACVLRDRGRFLLVSDTGPLAPFTTLHADALVCPSADPAEMRRQRALAGPRPVLWTADAPGADARALARDLGFATPGPMQED
jgi:hypothetical protein